MSESLGQLRNMAHDGMARSSSYQEPTMLQGLIDKRTRLESQLADTNAAITALESNPEVATTLEFTLKALRC